MREDEVAQKRVRLACFHCHGHKVDDFGRIHAEEGGTKYFSRFFVDDSFQQAVGLFQRMGAWNGCGWQTDDADIDALFFRVVFAQSNAGQGRVDEDGIGERCAVFGIAAMVAEQVVPDNAIVVQ